MRTIALLLSGVLPLAIQPSALAGQIAASRSVDRMVSDLPEPLSIEELVRLLAKSAEKEGGDTGTDKVPADVLAVIAQCKLLSLMSDSVALQATEVAAPDVAVCASVTNVLDAPLRFVEDLAVPSSSVIAPVRRLSDEQPLGP